MRAVLALDRKDYSKHSAVISFFTKDYIMTEQFDRAFSKSIKLVEMLRSSSDYSDYRDATHEEADDVVQKASEFCEVVKIYIKQRIMLK
jgi:uncharacterized protein (UPF0332 family)